MTTYLLRCVEIGREQQARHGKLRRDLAAVIESRWPDVSIELAPGRLLLQGPPDLAPALAALPGVLSVSPCTQVARADLVRAAVELARSALAASAPSRAASATSSDPRAASTEFSRGPGGSAFAVRVRRDRRLDAERQSDAERRPDGVDAERSVDMAGTIAEAITAATGARVDLDNPDVTIGVELRGDTALVFVHVLPGIDLVGPTTPVAPGEPRFVADQMLGRLAARLRLLGYDTLTVHDLADSEVTRLATGRILLTRDAALARTQAVPTQFVHATSAREQLVEVITALGLVPDPARLFTRCTLCNTPVEPADESDVDIPPGVRNQGLAFVRCPGCTQVYWRGSHVDRILDELGGLYSRKSTDASR